MFSISRSFAVSTLLLARLCAQTPELLRDINLLPATPLSSFPASLAASGRTIYLAADDGLGGAELFATTGAPGSTRRVADVRPGRVGSAPADFVAVAGRTYFTADDGAHGREPWVTDGTAAGTQLAADLTPGIVGSAPALLTEFAGALFLRTGAVVQRVDPQGLGSQPILATSGQPRAMIVHGGALWILVDSLRGFVGVELYRSDGTLAGTQRVAGVAGEVATTMLVSFGGELWFRTVAGGLYRSDGTAAGTLRVLSLGVDSGFESEMSVSPVGLCVTGIDRAGAARPVLLVNNGSGFVELPLGAGATVVHSLIADGQRLFFAVGGAQPGLFVTDGTPAGTSRVRTLPAPLGNPSTRASLGGRVVFAFGANGDREMWTSDGTSAGTRVLRGIELAPGGRPTSLTLVPGERAAVFAADTIGRGRELLRTDGSDAGTVLVDDIAFVPGTANSSPASFVTLGAKTLFVADDGVHGQELWCTDLESGTNLLRDILPGLGGSRPSELVSGAGLAWFSADDGVAGRELWVSDGTPVGTRRVVDLAVGVDNGAPEWITPLPDGSVMFAGGTSATGHELWVSDGTAVGTRMVVDLRPGAIGANPNRPTAVGDKVLFAADDGVNGESVWWTDGTAAGTIRLPLAPVLGAPLGLAFVGGRLVFVARDVVGAGVWSSDIGGVGTQLLARVAAPSRRSGPIGVADVAVANGEVFFAGVDSAAGAEPWVSDGTPAGTRRILELVPGPDSAGPHLFVTVDDRVLFASSRGLWRTAGTASSTVLVEGATTAIRDMVVTGSRFAWFTNVDRAGERSLWRTDGSPTNTRRLDLRLDDRSGRQLAATPGRLLAALADTSVGSELFAVSAGATVRTFGFACGAAVRGRVSATDPVLGASLRLRGADLAASAGGLLLGVPALAPTLLPGSHCAIHANLVAPLWLLPLALPAGQFDVGLAVPDTLDLLGSRIVAQTLLATATGPTGLETTTALELTLGR